MKSNFSISITKPCSADWNTMNPNEQGKFCSLCSLTVVDFTKMNNQEIKEYFLYHHSQKTCGRFKTSQLENQPIKAFRPIVSYKTEKHILKSYLQAAILSILAVLTFLTGCRKPISNSKPYHIMGDVDIETMGEPKFNIEQVDTLKTTPRTIMGDTTYYIEKIDTIKTVPPNKNPSK